MTNYLIKCMKTVFKGGVLDVWLPLGENGRQRFLAGFCVGESKSEGEVGRETCRSSFEEQKSWPAYLTSNGPMQHGTRSRVAP